MPLLFGDLGALAGHIGLGALDAVDADGSKDLVLAQRERATLGELKHGQEGDDELLDGDATTEPLVVTFLAMLELAKRGSLTLSQDEIFGTIQINRVEGAEAYVPGEGPELTE